MPAVSTDLTWKAIYDRLVAASVAGARIHDEVPAEPVFPFVALGGFVDTEDDVQGGEAAEIVVTLDVWSEYRGTKETNDIIAEIRDQVHNQTLTVPGLTSACAWVDGTNVFLDADGVRRHGVVRVRVIARQ